MYYVKWWCPFFLAVVLLASLVQRDGSYVKIAQVQPGFFALHLRPISRVKLPLAVHPFYP